MVSKNRLFLWALLFSLISLTANAQVPSPGKLPAKPILIWNATIHDGLGKTWDKGFVQINGKTITAIGIKNQPPSSAEMQGMEVVDAQGGHVYPGFILMNTPLGLNEIDAVRATVDKEETGTLNPNVYALPAYNTDSDIIPTLRFNGVLMAQICPRGPRFRGISAVVQLDAWNWEDAVVRHRDGMHLKWPSKYRPSGWWAEPGPLEKNKEGNKDLDEVKALFESARQYVAIENPPVNTLLEPFRDLFSGKMSLYIHAQYATDIVAALQYFSSIGIPKMVLVTGTQVLHVKELVRSLHVPVVVNRIHSLPEINEEPVDLQVQLPGLLRKAGIMVALDYEGDMEVMGARNLPFLAGSAARGGLTKEEALQSITYLPAKILGIENQVGSLAVGRDASLFISKGDALDMRSNQLSHAWIQGRPIRLESKQSALNQKFAEKLGQ